MGQEGPFTFHCPTPGCGHSYRATPALVGKLMVCKECHQKIRVPASNAAAAHAASISRRPARSTPAAPRAAEQQTAAPPSEETVQCPECRAACTIRPEWRGMTLECPTCGKQFVVPAQSRSAAGRVTPAESASRVAAFTTDDSAIKSLNEQQPLPSDFFAVTAEPEPPPLPAAPAWNAPGADSALQQAAPRKKKKRKNRLTILEDIADSPVLLGFFGGVVVLVLVVLGCFFPGMAFALRLVGGLCVAAGSVFALRTAFEESATCGIIYLFDCSSIYRIYYTATRWSEMRMPFFAQIAGGLLCVPWLVQTLEDEHWHRRPRPVIDNEMDDSDDLPPQFQNPQLPPAQFAPPGNAQPVGQPGAVPGPIPLGQPGGVPAAAPGGQPNAAPSAAPPGQPGAAPGAVPGAQPGAAPNAPPGGQPGAGPTSDP